MKTIVALVFGSLLVPSPEIASMPQTATSLITPSYAEAKYNKSQKARRQRKSRSGRDLKPFYEVRREASEQGNLYVDMLENKTAPNELMYTYEVNVYDTDSAQEASNLSLSPEAGEVFEEINVNLPRELPTIFEHIAYCESGNTQWDSNGNVIRGVVNPMDIGKYQINTAVWGDEAYKLGYDVYTEDGNEAMALELYRRQGTDPWHASEWCWGPYR